MSEAIANCVHQVGIELDEALRMASLYPAKAIKLDHQLGRIAPGYIANLAIFDDRLTIVGVVDQGQCQAFDAAFTLPKSSPARRHPGTAINHLR